MKDYMQVRGMAVTTASTHFTYTRMDGDTELAWVAWLNTTKVYREWSSISTLTWLNVE